MEFKNRYKSLNERQRQAVDTIDGPLLVIAGPGTGKTELLSMRTANILTKTDVLPSNILCLTFTESGASNMRERLVDIIGEAAYKVAIHTFHSFGVEIINQNRDYFFRGADFRPADDLSQYEILKTIFDELDWNNPIAAKRDDEYIYLKETLTIISELKKSGLVGEELHKIISANLDVIEVVNPRITAVFADRISKSTAANLAPIAELAASIEQPKLPTGITPYANVIALSIAHAVDEAISTDSTKPITAWKNEWCTKNEKGETVLKDSRRVEKLHAINFVYSQYLARMSDAMLYDYDDMILNVIHAIEMNPELRANLAEKYQYIMIDEFQDTNLAQLRLLFDLTNHDQPNLMAVGDDDQAIFSFQGADIGNIQRFRERLDNPPIVVLTDNYRSTEPIIASARKVITQGEDRLERTIENLSKDLTTHSAAEPIDIRITEHDSEVDEKAALAQMISEKIEKGTKPESIAVIARRHFELIELLPYLEAKNIAVNYEKQDNALDHPLIKLIELMSQTLFLLFKGEHEAANGLLPELIGHPSLGIDSIDIWDLSLSSWRNKQLWLETMLVKPKLKPLAEWLIMRSQAIPNESLEEYIDHLIGVPGDDTENASYNSPIYEYYFSTKKLNEQPDAYLGALEALRTIRNALRDHYDNQNPDLSLFLDFLSTHHELDARLTTIRQRSNQAIDQINLLTAHKAKGLEFDHVYIINATDNRWGEKARSKSRLVPYPANLPLEPVGGNYDERLRLFFVAMTRAKKELSISYAKADPKGKPQLIASFLSEFTSDSMSSEQSLATMNQLVEIDWRSRLARPLTGNLKALLEPNLTRYKLSSTHLNNFLDVSRGGPTEFLVNSLLRFPQGKSASASFGTAVHAILSKVHSEVNLTGSMKPVEDILGDYEKILQEQGLSKSDFNDYLAKGVDALNSYLTKKASSFRPGQKTELSFAGQNVFIDGIHLTGALDLAEIDKTNKTIRVTDYKTGRPSRDWKGKSDYEKIKLHKYRHQLMFYQLLIANSTDYSGYSFDSGVLQFIEPENNTGDILALEDRFSAEDLAEFLKLIKVVWQKIVNLDLPDTSKYSADYKGMLEFEADLLKGAD